MTDNKPKIVYEILVENIIDTRVLIIYVATQRALDWIIKEGPKYSEDKLFYHLIKNQSPPYRATLVVSPCFNVDEVKEYLENPDFENIEPIKLVK